MRYNYEERKALAEANRVFNEAVEASRNARADAERAGAAVNNALVARTKLYKAAEERYQKSERERAAKQRERDASWKAVKARIAADARAAEAKAQRSFEERVDAFTEDLKRSLAEHDLKFIGGWVKSEFSMVPPTYQGTHVELASTTSEHKATLRVQIGQGLKR
jgi:hypothetical protein